jgi:hypothetical protein
MLAALEIQAAQTWWHVRESDNMYEEVFTRENKVVGVLGLTRGIVDYGLLHVNGESVGLEFKCFPFCQSLRSYSLMLIS